MYTPITTNDGDCIDSGYIESVFENLEYFNTCSKTNSQQFTCKRINETQTGPLRTSTTEMCFDIQTLSSLVNPNSGSDTECKMLLFNIRSSSDRIFNDSDNPGQVTTTRTARIVCNGSTIQSLTPEQMRAPIICAKFECPSNSDVQVCFDTRVTASGQATLQSNSSQTIELCGSLICIKETTNEGIDGYFSPPAVDPDCCYGREALHLAIQNVSALRVGFAEFGQIPTCRVETFDDQDDHVLLNTAPTETDFLILGSLMICGTNASTSSDATITGNPRFSCGSDSYECLSAERIIPAADGDGPNSRCVNVPVVMCGTCAKGETLTSSIRSQLICNEAPSQVVEGFQTEITIVEQHYCVYLFSRIESDFGDDLNGSLGKCIDIDTITAINDNMGLINATCDSQRAINLTTREVSGVGDRGECVVIQAAQPWPPADDPTNTDPVPVKKWYLLGSVRPCISSFNSANLEEVIKVRAEAEIACGGNALLNKAIVWQAAGSGSSSRCWFPMTFSRCIECPIDQDLTACFSGSTLIGFGVRPDEFTYSFKVLCF